MGTVLGALLSDCALEAKVDLISRNRAHVEGLKKSGAHVVCTASGSEFIRNGKRAVAPRKCRKNTTSYF